MLDPVLYAEKREIPTQNQNTQPTKKINKAPKTTTQTPHFFLSFLFYLSSYSFASSSPPSQVPFSFEGGRSPNFISPIHNTFQPTNNPLRSAPPQGALIEGGRWSAWLAQPDHQPTNQSHRASPSQTHPTITLTHSQNHSTRGVPGDSKTPFIGASLAPCKNFLTFVVNLKYPHQHHKI